MTHEIVDNMGATGPDTPGRAPWALVDRPDLVPLCPHCDRQLHEVYRRGTGFPVGQGRTLVYFCPHCSKVLGFAQGRVF